MLVVSDKTARAVCKNIKTSPQKLGLITAQIRGKGVSDALEVLAASTKRSSVPVYKTLMSALANAEENHGMRIETLLVSNIYVGKSFVLRRFKARARGRGSKIMKPYSQLTVVLREKNRVSN